jgi:hypothetical protein
LKVDQDAMLTCLTCGVEGPHELLYLSEHLRASRCANCGATRVYSGHIYVEYAKDLARRTARLPLSLAEDVVRRPTSLLGLPMKVLLKPAGLLSEVNLVKTFERDRRGSASDGGGRV